MAEIHPTTERLFDAFSNQQLQSMTQTGQIQAAGVNNILRDMSNYPNTPLENQSYYASAANAQKMNTTPVAPSTTAS